ncbi:hypothetical protein L9F63_000164 [Diploptera punctata]|uniref:Uncharacterized protein n=1 Tax=Diploptera punctata TaxID=6984 RepID=A0AAD8ESZ5_DIPPU|nr:hypothetical protein L9F63_000164 [Diploptera punctata]
MHSVVAAILPPTLTKLDLGSKHSHNTGDHSFNFVIHPVYQEIKKLEQLRFLRLDYLYTERTIHICNGFPKYLETVTTCGFFTDEDLKLLVDTCKHLKYLNISRSEKVTDASIEHILQINNLLGLYVVDTRISRDGITQIIKGLSAMQGNESCSQNLQKFGCSFPTENHFNMLIQHFPNINELWLENCDGNDLIPITKLQKLVSLHLGMVDNSGVFCHQALPILGERLVLLKLTKCYDFDLVQIGVSCKTLKCLHLTESGSTEDFPSNEVPCFSPDTQYPGFLTIECLQIELEYDPDMTESVLKQCLNVKKLNITLHEPEEFYILECQPLKEVEEIIWSPSAWIDMTFANQLLDSAQKLHIVIGLSFEEGPNYYRGVKFYDYI